MEMMKRGVKLGRVFGVKGEVKGEVKGSFLCFWCDGYDCYYVMDGGDL